MGVSRATIPRIRSIRLVPSLFTWRAGTVIVPNGEGGFVRCENQIAKRDISSRPLSPGEESFHSVSASASPEVHLLLLSRCPRSCLMKTRGGTKHKHHNNPRLYPPPPRA